MLRYIVLEAHSIVSYLWRHAVLLLNAIVGEAHIIVVYVLLHEICYRIAYYFRHSLVGLGVIPSVSQLGSILLTHQEL